MYQEEYDGKLKRWRVRCGFVCEGKQCSVVGESGLNHEAPKAKSVKIFCKKHAREDGRIWKGRNQKLMNYVMSVSSEDKKRAREDQKHVNGQKPRKKNSPAAERKQTVSGWLGSVRFEECNRYHADLVLNELRIPPLLLGRNKDPTRVYLLSSFALADLKYLFEKRADGRMLYLVRGSSIIRCDIISFVGHAWFIFQKH